MVYFELAEHQPDWRFRGVSILVLMDGVLRDRKRAIRSARFAVSILVLMDGVLRGGTVFTPSLSICVSILVLMDGVLRAVTVSLPNFSPPSFNPCSNGWCTSRCFFFKG